MKSYIYTLIVPIGLLFFSCQTKESDIESTLDPQAETNIIISKEQFLSSEFQLGKVTNERFSHTLSVPGVISLPKRSQANISSLVSGKVGSFNWIEGQWVNKGDILFEVVNPELIDWQEEYLVLESSIEYAKEEVVRLDKLIAQNLTSKKDFYKVKTDLQNNITKHAALGKKLNLFGINVQEISINKLITAYSVIAPISGYISEIKVLRGSYIDPSQVAMKIANVNHVYVDLSILEKDAGILQKNQSLTFTHQQKPNLINHAEIRLINKSVDDNHIIHANARITKADNPLIPGMYVNAKIQLEDTIYTALPESAVIKRGQDSFVLKLISDEADHYEFEEVKVNLIKSQNAFIALSNLALDNQKYLISGAYYMIQ